MLEKGFSPSSGRTAPETCIRGADNAGRENAGQNMQDMKLLHILVVFSLLLLLILSFITTSKGNTHKTQSNDYT